MTVIVKRRYPTTDERTALLANPNYIRWNMLCRLAFSAGVATHADFETRTHVGKIHKWMADVLNIDPDEDHHPDFVGWYRFSVVVQEGTDGAT